MAQYDMPINTYSDTLAHERIISDVISMIDPTDTPLLSLLGLDSARSKFRIRGNGTKPEWLEDALDPLTTTVSNGTVTVTTDTLSFGVADASTLQVGHIILVDSEYMVVSAVNTTTNTITVYSRSYGGTNATHNHDTPTVEVVGMARLEGADASFGPVQTLTNPYNYTQILQAGVKVTGTMQAIDQYGIADEFAYQAAKKLPNLFIQLEKMLFNGVRAVGSATTPRSAGGLLTFITDNSVNANGGIAKSDVDNLAEAVYADGGKPKILVANHAVIGDLKALLDSSSFVRVPQETNSLGLGPLERFVSQYGSFQLVMDRWCPVSKAFLLDPDKIGFYTLRPFASKMLAVEGDAIRGEVVGEFSLCVKNDKGHGWIYGITS